MRNLIGRDLTLRRIGRRRGGSGSPGSGPAYSGPPVLAGQIAESSSDTAGTSHTATLPAGVEAGELLLVVFSNNDGYMGDYIATTSRDITSAPAGWTYRGGDYVGAINATYTIWTKTAEAGEPNPTWVTSGNTDHKFLAMRFKGVDVDNPIDASALTAFTTTGTCTGVTSTVNGALLLTVALGDTSRSFTVSNQSDDWADLVSGGHSLYANLNAAPAAAGKQPDFDVTLSGASLGRAGQFALKPATAQPAPYTLQSSVPGVTFSLSGFTITASGGAYDGASATFSQAQIDSGLPLQIAAPVQLADTGETRNILPGLYASTNVIEYLTRWYRSGAEIVGETGSSYTFVAGDDLLDIEYRETASTIAGNAAGAPHVVIVNEAPSFAPTVFTENFSALSVGATEATIKTNADLAPLVTNNLGCSIVANASAPGGKAVLASTYTTLYLDGVTIPADWTHLIIRAAYQRTQFPPPSTRYDIIRLENLGAEVAYAQASHETSGQLSTKAWMGAGSTGDRFDVTGGHQTLELGLRNSGGTSYLYAKAFDQNDVQRAHRFIAKASLTPIDRIRISTAAPDYLYAGIRVEFHNRTDSTNPDGWPTE